MTEREIQQQQEIQRLQKKVKSLTEAYSQTATELQKLKSGMAPRRKGRPGLAQSQKARILSLYQQGNTMRQVAETTRTAVSTVHKVITQAAARTRVVYLYMDREEPATLMDVCNATHRIKIINFTDDLISRAFGIRTKPTWEDYEDFLETRCMPRTRYGVREELRNLGLDFYDPVLIIEKTGGRVYEDSQWLRKMDEGWIEAYDKIQSQTKDSETLKRRLRELLICQKEEKAWNDTSEDAAKNDGGEGDNVLQRKSE